MIFNNRNIQSVSTEPSKIFIQLCILLNSSSLSTSVESVMALVTLYQEWSIVRQPANTKFLGFFCDSFVEIHS